MHETVRTTKLCSKLHKHFTDLLTFYPCKAVGVACCCTKTIEFSDRRFENCALPHVISYYSSKSPLGITPIQFTDLPTFNH